MGEDTTNDRLAEHGAGEAMVCGLDVEIEPPEEADDTPTVHVRPGFAFDSCGRPIVVADDTAEKIPAEKLGGDGVSVFIEYAASKTESVPVSGSEEAFKEEFPSNSLQETITISFESGPPNEQKPVPVDRVRFPPRGDEIDSSDDALQELLVSYHRSQEEDDSGDGRRSLPCDTPESPKVFLGHFTQQNGSWTLDTEDGEASERNSHLYTNDMLSAGLVSHATDFENPHETGIEVLDPDDGDVDALVSLENTDDKVELHSRSETLQIIPDPDTNRIEFELTGVLQELGGFLEEDRDIDTVGDLLDRLDATEQLLDR